MSEKAYLAAAAANEQDLPALPNLEQAVADFEERFHQAGVGRVASSKCAQTRVGRRERVPREIAKCPEIEATKENLPGSSMRMNKAALFESGEDWQSKSASGTVCM